ncbi:unnamed protein product [Somion occarium]|uniref:DUF2461 domain-containing protein n=1 Tax=Somion occarium TaxID=3059160 RepID=A0ABP1DSQ6_9APHY
MPPKSKTKATKGGKKASGQKSKAQSTGSTRSQPSPRKKGSEPSESDASDEPLSEDDTEEVDDSDAYQYSAREEEDDEASLHSDALDEVEDIRPAKDTTSRKRTRNSDTRGAAKASPAKKGKTKSSPKKKRKTKGSDAEDDDDLELEEGQEIVGVVVQAPKTGRVPPGQISQNTFNFLSDLKTPECNDREWFKLHEPVYRVAEKEWKDFIDEFTVLLTEADPQIPPLPPKDVIHRIYRDIRFSNDKTPYKTNFSASFSRSGRKGIFAGYHICISPGGQSLIAAGSWQPGKNELSTIRNNILRSSRRLREIISDPTFVGLFGEPKPHPKGLRRNIFGMEDELKVAPKGIDKNHNFTDKQVLQEDFKEELARLVTLLRPFVHCINDLMTLQNGDQDSSSEDGEDGEEDEDQDDEGEQS